MAETITPVSSPNQIAVEFEFAGYKARMVDITFDSSYAQAGAETVTLAQFGWTGFVGAIIMDGGAKNAAGTSILPVVVRPATNGSTLNFQLYRYDGAQAGKASLEEAAAAFDASLFTVRAIVLGY